LILYKNSQNAIKINKPPNYLKKVLSHENRLKNVLHNMGCKYYLQPITNFFFGQNKKIHVLWYCLINQIAKFRGFWWTLGLVQFFQIAQRMTQYSFTNITYIGDVAAKAFRVSNNYASDDVSSIPHTKSHFFISNI
jgi:hypothetical protein